jgi:hypothetical protein
MRNRVITQAFPGEGATGDFIKCLFGVPDCKASSDAGNPDASELPETGEQKQGDKTNGDQKNPQPVGDGSSEAALEDVSKTAASSAGDLTNKILSNVIARAGALSMLDSLSRFDQALHDHKLSKVIVAARAAQAAGMFSVFGVAADQLTTGQQSSSEVNDFMLQFKHGTNAEGWTKVVDPQGGQGAASAASTGYTQAKDKAEFCSPQHQAEMDAHPKQAEKEFQWLCPKDRVGGGNNAQELEDAWNSGAGGVLHPMLAAFRSSVGGVFDVFNSVIGAVTDPLIHAGLSVTGTQDDVNRAVAWGGGKALQFGGFNTVSDDTPSGQISNQVLQGSSVIAEASTRDQGGIPSTAVSMQETQKQLAEAQQEYGQTSAFNRYLSPSNPKSLFARELFAITTSGFTDIGKNFIGVFGAALSNPLRALTQPAHAAVPDGYAACHFTGITCMDIPQQCIDGPTVGMTPRQATNADDLGYFKPGELSWDLLNNRNDWYKALYDKVGGDEDKALKVYNCALFDDAARGSMSARYGYAGVNSFQSGGQSAQSGGSAAAVSGDARQLAQQILNNNKISKTGRYVTEDLQHTANGVPAYGNVNIALNLLQFMAELGETTPFTITSITGAGCGHDITNGVSLCVSQGGNSNHYFGKAVDFGCGFDEAKADEVAKKYGLMAQNERCDSGINHSHFSKDGY